MSCTSSPQGPDCTPASRDEPAPPAAAPPAEHAPAKPNEDETGGACAAAPATEAAAAALLVGVDVGSTTLKVAALEAATSRSVFEHYERHKGDLATALVGAVRSLAAAVGPQARARVAITGSAGVQVAHALGDLPHVQEVLACAQGVRDLVHPAADAAFELGGEDAKLLRFGPNGALADAKMNAACAAGTGAFVDQMAALLNTDAAGLDALAAHAQRVHPVASRCGVFAKTDLQAMLSADGATREDAAASVLAAVARQAVAGLAAGKPLAGRVALVGGPLHFLPRLREAFATALGDAVQVCSVERGQGVVCRGAALLARTEGSVELPVAFLEARVQRLAAKGAELLVDPVHRLPPLFKGPEEIEAFRARHAKASVARRALAECRPPAFLGIDAGSTTLKVVLVDSEGAMLESFYGCHQGDPLRCAITAVVPVLERAQAAGVPIARFVVTGYGEYLLRSALHADGGVVETVAHLRAARAFLPDANFVLDIGGQDMKAIRVGASGEIADVCLNEACSSGCGSFIQTLASSLGVTVSELAAAGLTSDAPLDLGTRCTVFMNSRVKQAQKDGASLADLSAGLALAVVRNALFKVVRLRSVDELAGARVVVQGGTFLNDSILRAAEYLLDRDIVRPDVAGLMGALGAALEARGMWERSQRSGDSSMVSLDELRALQWTSEETRCGRCGNNCALTVHRFNNGRSHVTGNRCERGAVVGNDAAATEQKERPVDMFEWQRRRVFQYKPRKPEEAPRGRIGITRTLDMYDKFPFWSTCLGELGFTVVLSPESTEKQYTSGIATIPVESVCFPCKIVHGHVEALAKAHVPLLFMPCVPQGFSDASVDAEGSTVPRLNCVLVNSYADIVRACVKPQERLGMKIFDAPLPLHDLDSLARRLREQIAAMGLPPAKDAECRLAVAAGYEAQMRYYADVRAKGDEVLEFMSRTKTPGIVIACRPYHMDPLVAGGVSAMALSLGYCVLTSESVYHLGRDIPHPSTFWYHHWATNDSRIIAAAKACAPRTDLAFAHLVSFGCSVSPATDDCVRTIMAGASHPFASIKIDQSTALGAVRVRLRSLVAAMDEFRASHAQQEQSKPAAAAPAEAGKWELNTLARRCPRASEKQMLIFDFSSEHSGLWAAAFNASGFAARIMPHVPTVEASEIGYRFVHPDTCYGAALIIGQCIWCLRNQYDPDKTDLLWLHQGGACTAPYIGNLMRKAVVDAGFPQVAVHALNFNGMVDPGVTVSQALRVNMALSIGDVLQCVVHRVRPYEAVKGSATELYDKWQAQGAQFVASGNPIMFKSFVKKIVTEFDALPLSRDPLTDPKTRVGIVGLMGKCDVDLYSWLINKLESEEDCEVTPADFLEYSLLPAMNEKSDKKYLSTTFARRFATVANEFVVNLFRSPAVSVLSKSKRFADRVCTPTEELYQDVLQYISPAHQAGEGWVVLGHVIHLVRSGCRNVVICASYGCLSIDVGGKGVLAALRERVPEANVCIVDIDAGQTLVNQLNRIKLMLGSATDRKSSARASPGPTGSCLPQDLEDLGASAAVQATDAVTDQPAM
eukprot:m51a1_g9340 hypothetical protein (1549) ;mRNA; r:62883-68525